MPELPEVHTITTDLSKTLKNPVIKAIHIENNYNVHPSNELFIKNTINKSITRFNRTAKNIVFELDNGNFITIHLAMTGKLLIKRNNDLENSHMRVLFKIENNNGISEDIELRFCDTRKFGKIKYLTKAEYENLKQKYGPEPLAPDLTGAEFLAILQSKKSNVKNVLLDQSKISGLGNIYANDALWVAQVHPDTHTSKLTLKTASKLLEASREVLNEGIKNRGISMRDYVDAFGTKGSQQDHFRVYQHQTCTRCNSNIEFISLNGRGTYFCPICQVYAD